MMSRRTTRAGVLRSVTRSTSPERDKEGAVTNGDCHRCFMVVNQMSEGQGNARHVACQFVVMNFATGVLCVLLAKFLTDKSPVV